MRRTVIDEARFPGDRAGSSSPTWWRSRVGRCRGTSSRTRSGARRRPRPGRRRSACSPASSGPARRNGVDGAPASDERLRLLPARAARGKLGRRHRRGGRREEGGGRRSPRATWTAEAAAERAESLLRQTFLPGEDGTWVEEKRRELADVRGGPPTCWPRPCLRSGEPAEAATWAEQAIALEPFRETGYRRLMEAHVAAGTARRRCVCTSAAAGCSRRSSGPTRPRRPKRSTAACSSRRPPGRRRPPSEDEQDDAARRLYAQAATAGSCAGRRRRGSRCDRRRDPSPAEGCADDERSRRTRSSRSTLPARSRQRCRSAARPVAIASGAGSLWVANFDDRSVTRVDVSSRRAGADDPDRARPDGARCHGQRRLGDRRGRTGSPRSTRATTRSRRGLARSHTVRAAVLPRRPRRGRRSPPSVDLGRRSRRARRRGSTRASGRQTGIGRRRQRPVGDRSRCRLGLGDEQQDGTVTRIDPATLLPTTIPVGHGPSAVAVNARRRLGRERCRRTRWSASTPRRTRSRARRTSGTGRPRSSPPPSPCGWRTAATAP